MPAAGGTIVIAGAGHAGGRAAEALRAAGHTGRLVLVGDERHPPYERPPLSKQMLMAADPQPPLLRPRDAWAELGVELWSGVRVVELDAERGVLALSDGRVIAFDGALIATGTRPRRLAALEGGVMDVHYLRTLDDALTLRQALQPGAAVAVVGGGVIGLEVAAAAICRGCTVTVIELAHQVMARSLPADVARIVQAEHEKRGVAFRLGVSVAGSRPGGLLLSDATTLRADVAIVGVGVEADLSFAAALCDDVAAGIPVDAEGRTHCERIFAAGDVALQGGARIETWANAQNQAMRVAANMVGAPQPYRDPPWFWSDQYDINLQAVGTPQRGEIVLRGDPRALRFAAIAVQDGAIVGAVTVNAPRDMAMLRRLTAVRARVARADLENPGFDLRRAAAGRA